MPSRTLSSLVTVFMFLLVLAVPLMAIFGIPGQPQPQNMHAATETADASAVEPPTPELGVGESVYHPAADLFASTGNNGGEHTPPDFAADSSAPPFPMGESADSDMGAEVTIDERNGGLSSTAASVGGPEGSSGRPGSSAAVANGRGSWSPPPGALEGWEPERNPVSPRSGHGSRSPQSGAPPASRGVTANDEFGSGDPFEGQPLAPLDSTGAAGAGERFAGQEAVVESGSADAAGPAEGRFIAGATGAGADQGGRTAGAFNEEQRKPAGSPEVAEIPESWKSALAQLQALGISEYQLQPGVRDGAYHFWCAVDAEDNPRISRRFEAEADEPLLAVRKVLAQVEQWRRPPMR